MKDYAYVGWFMAVCFILILNQCQQNYYSSHIVSELGQLQREIKHK